MGISPMKKVQIYVHLSKISEILTSLQRAEIIEITDIDEDFIAPCETTGFCSRDFIQIIDFLKEVNPEEKSFIENFIPQKTLIKRADFFSLLKQKEQVLEQLDSFKNLDLAWQSLKKNKQNLITEIEKLQFLNHFSVNTEKLKSIKKVSLVFGYLPLANYDKLKKTNKLKQDTADYHEEILDLDEKFVYLAYCYLPEQEKRIGDFLAAIGLVQVVIPETKVPFKELLIQAVKNLEKVNQEEAELRKKVREVISKDKPSLAVLADYYRNEENIRIYSENLLETKKVALIEGWILTKRFNELKDILKKYAKDVFINETKPSAEEKPPVYLENGPISPFESVTSVYGFPNQNEFDPTPYLSVFFIVFYGLCLSDFGYGLMLVIFALFLYFKYKKQLTGFGRKLLILNSWCGFSTMAVGILTGSYFGIDLQKLTYLPLKNFLIGLRLNDPITNPLPMLYLSLALGVIQIYTGLWIKFLLDWKQKGFKEGFLASGIWVCFVSGIIVWPLTSNFWPNSLPVIMAKLTVLVGAVALILTQGRHHKNPFMRLGSGILSLYRLTGFAGDILSYSRLFALGLVTSVLASVINLLAGMTGGIPAFGWLIMAAILVFGHIFDFFINILGSFVHSARLQYVEYFSKFFEGGGNLFKPFSWKTKYIKVEE